VPPPAIQHQSADGDVLSLTRHRPPKHDNYPQSSREPASNLTTKADSFLAHHNRCGPNVRGYRALVPSRQSWCCENVPLSHRAVHPNIPRHSRWSHLPSVWKYGFHCCAFVSPRNRHRGLRVLLTVLGFGCQQKENPSPPIARLVGAIESSPIGTAEAPIADADPAR